jgi:peptidoglycan/xylan/chitin deacetylase (PgdA/CDA1 family)
MWEHLQQRIVALALAAVLSVAGAVAGPRIAHVQLPHMLPQRTIALPILLYHRIGPLSTALPALTKRLTVSPADFAAQMAWLVRHGYHAVSELQAFDALEHGGKLPRNPLMITFDDGYRDVLWNAAPVLRRLHLRATDFVITGRISGPDSSFLTWPELVRLERLGVEIGSHTVTHADLPALSAAAAVPELRKSRLTLERHLRRAVQWLAYPYGKTDAAVASLARKAGYVLAMTEMPGSSQSARRPFFLHRDEILDTTGVSGLAADLAR